MVNVERRILQGFSAKSVVVMFTVGRTRDGLLSRMQVELVLAHLICDSWLPDTRIRAPLCGTVREMQGCEVVWREAARPDLEDSNSATVSST